MKTEIMLITPAIAEKILKKSKLNRVIKERLVNEYARQMRNGLWIEETGEAIKIAVNGEPLDGHHRLLALIKAQVSLSFLVVSDLENAIFPILDTGVSRTAGDIFHIAGITQSNNHAAIITKYLKLKKGETSPLNATNGSGSLRDSGISKGELLSIYTHRKQFWDASLLMSDKWNTLFQRVLSKSEIGSLYAYFFDINEDDAFEFMNSLCNGNELEKTNPIKLLREKLIFSKANLKFKLAAVQKLGIIFKAWNYFRKNQSISVLRFSRELDNFPTPI